VIRKAFLKIENEIIIKQISKSKLFLLKIYQIFKYDNLNKMQIIQS